MDVFLQTEQKAQEDVQGAVPPLQSVNLLPTNDTLDGSPKAELEKTLSHIPAMASQNTMQTVSQVRSENLDPNGGNCMEMFQPTDQLHFPTNRKTPGKSTVATIRNVKDGLSGIITDLPYDKDGGSARSGGSGAVSRRSKKRSSYGNSDPEPLDNLQLRQRGTAKDLLAGSSLKRVESSLEKPQAEKYQVSKEETENEKEVACCGFFEAIGLTYDELPDLPHKNLLGMKLTHPVRKMAVELAINHRLEQFWLFLGVVHFLIPFPEIQDNVFGCTVIPESQRSDEFPYKGCKHQLPNWYRLIFLFLFSVEAMIKILGLGLVGGQFAWWTHDFYNKLDVISLLHYFYETISTLRAGNATSLSLRGLRLTRLFKPLSKLIVFSELDTIFISIGKSLKPMATVLLFIWFVMVLFGIIGMTIWGKGSFRRRCVWVDTLEIKLPEQSCKRDQLFVGFPYCTKPPLNMKNNSACFANTTSQRKQATAREDRQPAGLDNSCGPFQLCLDIGNPNLGFTSFDHLPVSLLSLFQVLSGDDDVGILWRGIESEPASRVLTTIYFLVFCFLVLHVLINIFVAVFASIFAEIREERVQMIAKMSKDMNLGDKYSSIAESEANSTTAATPVAAEVADFEDYTTKQKNEETARQLELLAKRSKEIEDEKNVGNADWIEKNFRKPIDPSLQRTLSPWVRDNYLFDTLCFLVTTCQVVCLALVGGLCKTEDCAIDEILEEIIKGCNYFFILDAVVQVIADGSLSQHFASGERIFNLSVTFLTTLGLLLLAQGVGKSSVAALMGMAIFRVLRMCKLSSILTPVWLMLVKTTGSAIPVMNLVLFNTFFSVIYFSIGQSLFQNTLNSSDARYSYVSLSRGYSLLLVVMTGDGWSAYMYEAMAVFCTGEGIDATCDDYFGVMIASFIYVFWFFYAQFLFLTMFLAIILEAFAVEDFMEAAEKEEDDFQLNRKETLSAIAEFQMIPEYLVHPALVRLAFQSISDGSKTISKNQLLTMIRMVQPFVRWRLIKTSGIPEMRFRLRNSFCACWADTYLKPWPGDEDYIYDGIVITEDMDEEAAERAVSHKMSRQIKNYLEKIVLRGLNGELLLVCRIKGLLDHVDLKNVANTEAVIGVKILRAESMAQALGIKGLFDSLVADMIDGDRSKKFSKSNLNPDAENAKYFGLDVSKIPGFEKRIDRNDYRAVFMAAWRVWSVKLIKSRLFDSVMLGAIVASSAFLCLETPHETIPGYLSPFAMKLGNLIFNIIFTFEFVAKSSAYGLYQPRSISVMSYLQQFQNRIDLFILVVAWAEMLGLGRYVGQNTTKVIRLLKVMRPVRLLLRSEGLKAVIEALVASLKPMAYATLFLLIICLLFSVTGMAFFKKRFFSCTDLSLDGNLNEGKPECLGVYVDQDTGVFQPRAWKAPPWGSNFDTLGSSIVTLCKCLTLAWSSYYQYAQDAVVEDIQPVNGHSFALASIYFQIFILVGSFFGLNLFASFMCDTFYSLQGTAQLEETQYRAVKQMLARNQPKIPRNPPKNPLSIFLRQLLGSQYWHNFSTFCLLLNVTFMGSTHVEEDENFQEFMETQNTVFFGIMVGETSLRLLSAGPTIYFLDRNNHFDIAIITLTSVTIILKVSASSAQTARILRLFKILKTLAKDKTIADVFETVAVSISQVANIMIILVIFILMLAVFSVQTLGTVRPGNRLGPQANFSSFFSAAHTIFQLMFGEDMPTLWDDCMVSPPECTPDVYDSTGQLLYVSDCGSFFSASFFFPTVLISTNYVMLNLFVGMIMNNFAYISCKSAGPLQDMSFEDAAHHYSTHFDEKITGQVPLDKVYMYYNMIGKPFGNYDKTKNWGRYLCVREDLKRIITRDPLSDGTGMSMFYTYIYFPLSQNLQSLRDEALTSWQILRQRVIEAEKACREACGDDEEVLNRMGLYRITDKDKRDAQQADIEDGKDEKTEYENGNGKHEADAQTAIQEEVEVINVHGGNMGVSKQGPPKPKVKQVKTKKNTALDRKEDEWREKNKQSALGVDIQKEDNEDIMLQLEKNLNKARKECNKCPRPRETLKIRFVTVLSKFCWLLLGTDEQNRRKPGHARYNEIMLALIYWNKEFNIVPEKVLQDRQEYDKEIKFEVASQIINAVCSGAIVRRRLVLRKKEVRIKLQQASRILAVNQKFSNIDKTRYRRQKIAPFQDENAKRNLWMFDTPESGPLCLMCCQIVTYSLLSGCELAEIAEEAGFEVGVNGIFELTEAQLECCFKRSHKLQENGTRAKIIDEMKSAMLAKSDIAPAYINLAAKKHDVDVGPSFQNLSKISLEQLEKIWYDPLIIDVLGYKQEIIAPHKALGESGDLENVHDDEEKQKILGEDAKKRKELEELKEQYRKQVEQIQELTVIIEDTKKRIATTESDLAKKAESLAVSRDMTENSIRRGKPTNSKIPSVSERGEDESEFETSHHKWWEAQDAGWAKTVDVLNLEQDEDHVQHVHIMPEDSDSCVHGLFIQNNSKLSYDSSHASFAFRPNTAPPGFGLKQEMHLPGQHDDLEIVSIDGNDDEEMQITTPYAEGSQDAFGGHCQSNISQETSQENAKESCLPVIRPFTAPEPIQRDNIRNLEESMQIAKAEIERLERVYAAVIREKQRQKGAMLDLSNHHQSPEQQRATEAARSRRDKKGGPPVDSESTSSGLLSPRDKATRQEILKRELANRHRGVQDRSGGGHTQGSSRQPSRHGSRPASRPCDSGLLF